MIIAIIGVGLIGGSIGLAIKDSKLKIQNVTGIGRNIERLKIAKKLGAVDKITTNFREGVKDADIIFVCLPVSLIADTVKKIIPFCKKGAIITDVGSVKTPIVKKVENFLFPIPSSLSPVFIGGHPIAGSEKTSVKYASKELFKNAVVILTPTTKTKKNALDIIKNLWKKMGAKVKIMSAEKHDKILSSTSHLPHIVAFSLVNSVDNFELVGNGFRDTTRIASSDPEMWADIIFHNRTNVRRTIRKFINELKKIEKAKSKKELLNYFRKAKIKREAKCNNRILSEDNLIKFIKVSLRQRRIPPSVREVAKYFAVSVSTAHQRLKNLYEKGLIFKRKSQNSSRRVARGITSKK
ncbi:MAG: prephenate dehydrogenase/arogenate dehydrogenase family protein [Elusimicrobiota bacterium]